MTDNSIINGELGKTNPELSKGVDRIVLEQKGIVKTDDQANQIITAAIMGLVLPYRFLLKASFDRNPYG